MRFPAAALLAFTLSAAPALPAEPGKLNLPLTVTDFSGVNRLGEVATGGVPMPRGLVRETAKLRVVDASGKPVPCQFTVIDRWWIEKPPSVRWLLIDLMADVGATESSTYYLRDDGGPKAPPTGLKVTETGEKVTVATGPLKFTVSKKAFNVIDEAWYDQNGDGELSDGEQYVLSSPENGGVATCGDWPDGGYKAGGKYYSSTRPPRKFVIEEQGPCRVLIRVDGTHHAREGGAPDGLYDYRARIQAFAGYPGVEVAYSISNMRVAEEWKVPPIRNFEVGTKVEIPGSHAVSFLLENDLMAGPPYVWGGAPQHFAFKWRPALWGRLCSDSRVTLYQDSSGGEQWKNLVPNGFNRRVFGGDAVPGVSFRGFKVFKDGKEEFAGRRCGGQVDIRKSGDRTAIPMIHAINPDRSGFKSNKSRGLTLTFREFRQHYPKALYGEKGRLAAKVFPEESGRTFHVNRASCRTHEMEFFFHGPKLYRLHYDWVAKRFENPLLVRAPVGWYARSEAYDMGVARTASIPLSEFDKHKLDGVRVGSEAYGWISPWNPGGQHWNEAAQFVPWVARGDWRAFQSAEVCTRWSRDLVQIQNECPREKIPRFWLYLRGWNLRESKIKELTYPGYRNTTKWIGIPDSGHMGMLMYLEHYRLSGDRFSRDAVERLGLRGRAYGWKYNYDDKVLRVGWCKDQDPDADPALRNDNRYTAWPLFDHMQGVSLTGDGKQFAEARRVALTYRNAVRYSPVGYLCLTINAKGSPEVYGKQYKPEKRGPGASAVYGTFQFGLVVIALAKYYEETGDEEALDAILATCDVMANRAMIRDGKGRPRGWSYCWGDVWGPSSTTSLMWNDDNLTALGYGYRFSGRRDFLEILKAAYEDTKYYYRPFSQVGYACVVHPRLDGQPPAAVKDLAAAAAGKGAVKLTWTAPGGDGKAGRAARYQVKHSRVKMVERVTDWPPPGVELPADAAGYRRLAAAHRARICSFYQARNAAGEPEPKPAGGGESFELKGLAPGRYWVALKSFDAARNTSELSNVVEVEVK